MTDLPTYSVKNCVYSFCLKHELTFFFLMLSRSFFIVNVLRYFRWYFMFGTTPSGKFDATSKTAWWWRMVAAFNNVFHYSMDWMLIKSSLASVQCNAAIRSWITFQLRAWNPFFILFRTHYLLICIFIIYSGIQK